MKRMFLVVVLLICCSGVYGFENYKEAFDSAMKKTEGFGEYDAARKEFQQAISLAKTPSEKGDAIFQIGETYFWQSKYKEAREEYTKIKGVEKITSAYKAMAQIRIADSYAAEKNYPQARLEYAKVLNMEGKVENTNNRRYASLPKVEAQYKIGEMYRAEGNYQKAKEEFAKIYSLEDASAKDKTEVKYRIKYIYR